MADDLRRMAIFAKVVQSNSFSLAARKLGLTRSAVSRQIALLEQALGVRLLNRTTRRLSLTEAGERYFESCARIVTEADEANRAVRDLQSNPTGRLRITGPVIGNKLLVPVLLDFMERYEDIKVDLVLEDQYVNLVEEGFDLAVRVGHPADSSLVARKLSPIEHLVIGAPSYFARRGEPRKPQDLTEHEWISYSLLASPNRLVFSHDDRRVVVRVNGRMHVNGGPAIREAVLAGFGVTLIPRFFVEDDLAAGRLKAVLTEFRASRSDLYAVYPHREHLPAKVRLFVDLLAEHLGTKPKDNAKPELAKVAAADRGT